MRNSVCRQEKDDRPFPGCKTGRVGAVMPGNGRELYYCCLDEASCSYALPVGYDIVCKHPDSELFQEEHSAAIPSVQPSAINKRSRS